MCIGQSDHSVCSIQGWCLMRKMLKISVMMMILLMGKWFQLPEHKMIQKYAVRKKLSGCFCIDGTADWVRSVWRWEDDSRFPSSSSLAKWGKMGNVIWENFKFSISLAIVRCAVEWGWTICSIFGSFFIFMNSTLGKGNFPKKSNSTYYKKVIISDSTTCSKCT